VKRESEFTLKEVISQLLDAYRWGNKLDEVKLVESWEKVVGGIIGRHTTNMQVRNKILYVKLDSAVLRSELHMAKSKIVESLNKEVGKDVIEDIVLR
jgi:predicted nucleic acid-binding Zn ribbon protein